MVDSTLGAVFFFSGAITGIFWAVLLWLNLPGQTVLSNKLPQPVSHIILPLCGIITWLLWCPFFGAIAALFIFIFWSTALSCLLPILWAIFTSYRVRTP